MFEKILQGAEQLGFKFKASTKAKPDYGTYGIALTSEKASKATRGDENCITEGSGQSWMSSTW